MSKAREHYEYEAQQAVQNAGGVCEHCQSDLGHFGFCPLINRATAEAASFISNEITEADRILAHGLGIIL